jgi:protein-S-isoprenylcysteine O-methyltransferase Ste14
MRNPELMLYVAHVAFWAAFGITRKLVSGRGGSAEPAAEPQVATEERTAAFSRALLVIHMIGFGVMYFGIANAVIPRRVPEWFAGQRAVGALVIALGAALCCWAVVAFRSWRFRAKLEKGHELATGGPFRFLRHPIYAGLDLLALGSAIWAPTPITWAGFALIAIGSDLRARSEETLLTDVFGQVYRDYLQRTKRFIPGIY